MSGRKNIMVTFGLVLSVSMIASISSVLLVFYHYSRCQFDLLNLICSEVVEREPETKIIISGVLKEYAKGDLRDKAQENILSVLGYSVYDFSDSVLGKNILFAVVGSVAGGSLFTVSFLYRNKMEAVRIRALIDYLEQVNTGKAVILSSFGEDDFSRLEDEIYKTVTYLYHTRDAAVQAKDDYAENLSNIAHQIKTPITAILLSIQMMERDAAEKTSSCASSRMAGCMADKGRYLGQVRKQVLRLAHLEEELLVLARIDAGTLFLQKDEVDVFTLLVLAADNLQELFAGFGVSIDIPESGGMSVIADLDWTMEAMMNLMKNCMEHNPGGRLHCSYAQNPLYTEIMIWDEGKGFVKEDIPHLFERFYRGQNAGEGGIGIGLALSKEIIERQNGTIQAKNRPGGGALFEIRFYSH